MADSLGQQNMERCITLEIGVYEALQSQIRQLQQQVETLTAKADCLQATERQLQATEAKFEKLAANVPGMIYQFLMDGDGSYCFPYVSSGCYEICGLDPLAVMADATLLEGRIHPDDRNGFHRSLTRSLRSLKAWDCEFRLITPQGQLKWLQGASRPEAQANGSVLFDGLLIDITEKKLAEAAVSQSEAKWRSLIQTSSDLITIQDAQGVFQYISPSFEWMLGYPLVSPQDTPWLDLIHPDDRDRLLQGFQQSLEDPHRLLSISQYRVRHQDGSWRYFQSTVRNLLQYPTVAGIVVNSQDITEQVEAERALRDSEERYRSVIAALAEGILFQDTTGKIIACNPSAERILGISAEEMLGQTATNPHWHTIREDGSEFPLQQLPIAHTLRTGEPCTDVIVGVYRPDGSLAWISVNSQPLFYPGETQPYAVVASFVDITQRKVAEEALKKSEQLYRLIARNFPNGAIYLFDQDLRYTLVEGTDLPQVWGIPEKQWEGQTLWEVLPPLVAQDAETRYRKALAGQSSIFEHTVEGKTCLIHILPLRDCENNEIMAGMVIRQNITDLKQTEAALRQSEAQLREEVQRINLLNQLASQIRNSLELDTILETTVRAIRDLLQLDRCNFSWYRPTYSPPAWETVKDATAPGFPSQVGVYPLEAVGIFGEKLAQGDMIWVDDVETCPETQLQIFLKTLGYQSTLVIPIQLQGGQFAALSCGYCQQQRAFSDREVALVKAVTDQVAIAINQAELYHKSAIAAHTAQQKSQELEKTLHELQRTQSHLIQSEKMSSLGQLVAGVAHEINNPVNFIYGNLSHVNNYGEDLIKLVELYQEKYPNPDRDIADEIEAIELDFLVEDFPKIIGSMKLGAERIREIVLSLRNFSRIDEAQVKQVNLHEGLDSTLLILHNRIKANADSSGIKIIRDYGEIPPVECFPGPLNQVFMNIISNAIDALDENGVGNYHQQQSQQTVRPSISIKTQNLSHQRIQISIIDNGIGIPEEVKNRLFDPFFTTKPVGKGTGLGLSISYEIIVERHQGQITCHSELGKGTEFRIELPVSQDIPT